MSTLRVRGVEIDFESFGPERAPTLLILRGLGTQRIQWPSALIEGFVERGFRVVAPDNRDAGLSQKFPDLSQKSPDDGRGGQDASEPYGLADMANDHAGLLDELGIACAHVMGISMGGMIVQQMAIRHPAKVRSLISIMSSSGAPGLPPPTEAAMAALTREPDDPSDPESVVENSLATQRVIGSPGFPTPEMEFRAMARKAYERCYCPDGVARQMRAVLGDSGRAERLPDLDVPTLVIHGEDDPLIPIEAGRDTAQRIPGAHFHAVAGMGHDIGPGLVPILVALVSEHAKAAESTSGS